MRAWGPASDPTPPPATYAGVVPGLNLPLLDGTVQADVAVVGGGITGLSAALHLAAAGARVAVLEAREVGWGGSGRAFGQVVPYSKLSEAAVLDRFGPERGERLLAGLAAGPDLVADLVAAHGIECELARTGLLFAAHAPAARAGLERRAAFWQTRGANTAVLDGAALEAVTGTRFYGAALLEPRGLCINPLAYTRGLARAALAAGAAVHGGTPALSLDRVGGAWHLRTPAGAVGAEKVVLATDAYTGNLWPGLRRRVLSLRGHQLVSRPLSDNLRRTVLPGGQPLTDTRRLYSGIRLRPDGRLHVSADGPALGPGQPDARAATRRVQRLFPHLPPPEWEHAVSGWVGITADHLPHLDWLAPGLLAATGLNGRGLAFGTLLGRDASRLLLGRPEHECMLPATPLPSLPPPPVARSLARLAIAGYRLLDAAELGRARP